MFHYDVPRHGCLWFYPVWITYLESVGLCLFANWGSFQLLFLQVLFTSAVFPFFFWVFSDTNVRYLKLCPCLFLVCFLSVHIWSFLLFYPQACWFFSLSTLFWIFYFDIFIFQLWDFHLVLLLSSIFLLRLSSFLFVPSMFLIANESIFMMAALKSTSALAHFVCLFKFKLWRFLFMERWVIFLLKINILAIM